MEGLTPTEIDLAHVRAMQDERMTHDRWFAWMENTRRVIALMEQHPQLPIPFIITSHITFNMVNHMGHAAAPARLAEVERILAALLAEPFKPSIDGTYYILEGVLPGGCKLRIKAWADDVVERKVTGQTVTDVVEWVRLPDEPEAATEPTDEAVGVPA